MPRLFSSSSRAADVATLDEPSANGRAPTLSVIGVGMRLEGTIQSAGAVKIEGTVIGDVRSDHQVLVAAGAAVEGDIHTPEAIVNGRVTGSIFADHRAELHPSSVIRGDIITKQLLMQEGSRVNGRLRTGEQKLNVEHSPRSAGVSPPSVAVAS